ncbi:ABC transporter ATP-binding protein [Pseudobutyrivibrio xylanivorans]|uniref:NitT/TauT family transport system ATP-binding protein n=1 Tax=Pseudobutyrivibrio xylanivorans DSM 14809 TaxID=1123012 RepID=A0A1M6AMM1_PSEXY|nr:ABC transporter ATP-binding protein [Pseudobutyrivibrio xylanivorans]SHI37657.1 NitT/TauT family transport system ATP-binding protein [Pseudobutyrivibrio xylanivorans DSM 14809]
MSYIHIENAGKTFVENGIEFTALSDVNLDIEKGEFICLLGPSGCGKSTLLNAIAGFDLANHGRVQIDGKEVTAPSTKNVTIFQNYGLLPWRTVVKNVELGLEAQGIDKKTRRKKALEYLKLVKLEDFANSFPRQLSGGMKQRVAIARALAVEPDIIFMDEPFGALDAITRMKLQDDILDICKNEKKTIIFVTHDIEEAVYLADRIVVMTPNPGKVKGVITVPLHHFRDRTSGDFLLVRDKIFDLLNMKIEDNIEYTI